MPPPQTPTAKDPTTGRRNSNYDPIKEAMEDALDADIKRLKQGKLGKLGGFMGMEYQERVFKLSRSDPSHLTVDYYKPVPNAADPEAEEYRGTGTVLRCIAHNSPFCCACG